MNLNKSIFKNFVAFVLAMSVLLKVSTFIVAANSNGNNSNDAKDGDVPCYNRYNIVFVVDASGSMSHTDSENLRFEAIEKFIALLAERGNRIGSVVFSDEITTRDVLSVDDITAKKGIVEDIKKITPNGFTDIGGALLSATKLLDNSENANKDNEQEELESIILLLSDGNTEMPTDKEYEASLSNKAEAIDQARNKGYTIHSVSLNADGTASPDELLQISNATGGLFSEVNSPLDLDKVYSMFYSVIFNSLDLSENLTTFPENGVINGSFTVPPVGVEEFNIVLSGKPTFYSLTTPMGITRSNEQLSDAVYSSETFTVIKFTEPLPGEWYYGIEGVPGDNIRIDLIFNTNLDAALSISPEKDDYLLSDNLTVNVSLTQDGDAVPVEDYDGFTSVLSVTKKGESESDNNTKTYEMELSENGFVYTFAPDDNGAYILYAEIKGGEHLVETNSIVVNFENTPPVFNEDIYHKIYLLPFSDNVSRIDLSPAVTDALSRKLKYEVVSSAFNEGEYTIENNENSETPELVVTSYSLNKGSLEIMAIDPLGGSVSFNVHITAINVALWTVIILGIAAFLVLILIGIITWLNLNKRFYGRCYVRSFNNEIGEYNEEIEITNPKRGKRRLPINRLRDTGINLNKCYFQASGKRYVWFCSKEPVYGQGINDKRFKIEGEGYEVQFSADKDGVKGIIVRFETDKRNKY